MKSKQIRKTIAYIFFWILGFFLLFQAFRNQDLSKVLDTLKTADLTWAFAVLAISVFNHFIRVYRWRLLIRPLGYQPKIIELFAGLMFGYLVSYAVPRLGEVSRCIAVNRTEKVPFAPLFGTVVTERIIDITCLFVVLVLAVFVEQDILSQFYFKELHPTFVDLFQHNFKEIRTIGISVVLIGTLSLAFIINRWKKIKKVPFIRKVLSFSIRIGRGIFSIIRMKTKWEFLGHTILIWLSYFLMTYLWFFCFEESSHLTWGAGLAIMVIGSFGRSLPIQGGGMGAYHYLVIHGLLLYGVSEVYGAALAIMIHGLQTIYYLIIGGIATLYLMFLKKVIN